MRPDAYLLHASRTPLGACGGALAGVAPGELARTVVARALASAGLVAQDVEAVVLATAYHAPAAAEIVHLALGRAVPILAIQGGDGPAGLEALARGAAAITRDGAGCVLVLGCDSSSQAPHLLPGSTQGARLGHGTLRSMPHLVLAGEPPVDFPDAPAGGALADAPVDVGTKRAPKVLANDDQPSAAWAPGDGAAAVLLGEARHAVRAQAHIDRLASAATLDEVARRLREPGDELVTPRAHRPNAPGALALVAVHDALGVLALGARAAVVAAGRATTGVTGLRLVRAHTLERGS